MGLPLTGMRIKPPNNLIPSVCYHVNTWQDDKPTPNKQDQSSPRLPSLSEGRERVEDVSDLVTLLDRALSGEGRGKRRGYPVTTAGEIGWRSANFSKLERFGRHARGQQGIRLQLNWPREAVH